MRLHDHWKAITFILTLVGILILILAFLNLFLAKNPALVQSIYPFVQKYGLPAGFLFAAAGSLWFIPFPYEFVVVPVMKFYSPPIIAILVISAGAMLADFFNFYSGRKLGEKYIYKKIEHATLMRIQNFFEKYGALTLVLFAFIGPVTSYDVVAFVIGGFSKMRFSFFAPLTFVCRVIHFTFVFLIADFLLKISGVVL